MAETLSIDFETRSPVDLRKTGVYPYAVDPNTDIWCMAYAFDDEEPELWTPDSGDAIQVVRLKDHVRAGRPLRAWNANFERIIWHFILGSRYGFPTPKREQWYDTAADAAALALPRALNRAALALGLDEEKDDEGYRLMMRMSRPRKPRKGEKVAPGEYLWWDEPGYLLRLYEYCKQDVRVERAVHKRIRPLSEYERGIWLLDSKINDRGVLIDVGLVKASQAVVKQAVVEANQELRELTEGEVKKVTKVKDLTEWIQAAGLPLENLRKDTIRDYLDSHLPMDPYLRRILELRQETAKSSTAKLNSMLAYAGPDGRARGMLMYHGAGTGRWAGMGPQPQNYPRPTIKNVEEFIPSILEGVYDEIALQEPPLMVISSLLRSMLIAAPGHRFLSGDFSQIEARIVAWIAGQQSLVDLFASGGKVYETMAAEIYGVPVSQIANPSEERQVGKNTVLGCGFGMGVDRFLEQILEQTGITLPYETGEKAVGAYRGLYPLIPAFWKDIERAAKDAVREPGAVTSCGRDEKIKYTFRGQFLWCVLPSGRPLAYAKPQIKKRTVKPKPHPVTGEEREPWETESLSFMGVNSVTKRWERQWSYGGHLTENVVQAMARDLMAAAMVRADEAGYPMVLTVHDEILAEVPEGHGSLDEFLRLMHITPQWAEGLPVAAEGWEGRRYRK